MAPRHELIELQRTLSQLERQLEVANAWIAEHRDCPKAHHADTASQAIRRIESLEEKLRKREHQVEEAAREAAELESRVAVALEDLDSARQHLKVTEVKLSILEAAANILDARMRATGRAPDDHR